MRRARIVLRYPASFCLVVASCTSGEDVVERLSRSITITVTDLDGDGTVECAGACDANNHYVVSSQRAAFALVYGGRHENGAKDWASDARRAVVAQWSNLFLESQCGYDVNLNKGCLNGLKRAWRLSDRATGTSEFLANLGLSPMPPAAGSGQPGVIDYCNAYSDPPVARYAGASDYLDNDPIRIPCDPKEQVCQPGVAVDAYGNPIPAKSGLGLVLPITVPSTADVPSGQIYPTVACENESSLVDGPVGGFGGTCPNGAPSFAGGCFVSIRHLSSGSTTPVCIQTNMPGAEPFLTPTGADPRGTNLWVWNDAGQMPRDRSLNTAGRAITGAFFRIHSTTSIGGLTCRHSDPGEQLVCLHNANPSSVVPQTFTSVPDGCSSWDDSVNECHGWAYNYRKAFEDRGDVNTRAFWDLYLSFENKQYCSPGFQGASTIRFLRIEREEGNGFSLGTPQWITGNTQTGCRYPEPNCVYAERGGGEPLWGWLTFDTMTVEGSTGHFRFEEGIASPPTRVWEGTFTSKTHGNCN